MRWLGIEDLAHRADAGAREVLAEALDDGHELLGPIRIHTAPSIEEWPDQPWPDGPLVVRDVARSEIAEVLRLIIGVPRRERAHAIRRQQTIVRDIDDSAPPLSIEDRVGQ